ncbi:SDR family NAD(P)-dependent oxidoreductase [Alteromonas portus]|uniref:SDR family NAD(P)-dependent oxidoreductase n=1 Tax=Alteromonas portus TaxID=2565549 RepID=UPI003BF8E6A8
MTDTYPSAGKTAIVTGGGKELGKTIAHFLLEAGMNVAICGRTENTIKQKQRKWTMA